MSEWISVDDAIPETCGSYLCKFGKERGDVAVFQWWDEWFDDLTRPVSYVTHWMPLPENPKE